MSDSSSTPLKTHAQIGRCADIKALAGLILGGALLFLIEKVMVHVMHGTSLVAGVIALTLAAFAIIAKLDDEDSRTVFVIAGGFVVLALVAYPVFANMYDADDYGGPFVYNVMSGIAGLGAAVISVLLFICLRSAFIKRCEEE